MRWLNISLLFALGALGLHGSLALLEDSPPTSEKDMDLVVIAYNSKEQIHHTLLSGSIDASSVKGKDAKNYKLTTVGTGQDLWKMDEDGPELKRGWMFRLRLTIKEVQEEYQRRGGDDFVVLLADALDVFVPQSLQEDTLELVKKRFMADFSDHKIVFASQIYCCNPWDLRSIARRDWDDFFARHGESGGSSSPPSIYKHLNAGTFIGYASAILEMADEMQLWDKSYHPHESFHSLMTNPEASERLHMHDLDVDDDEWQIATWLFEDYSKTHPLATLDYHQDLFAVTGTFRAQHRDEGFLIFSRDDFERMYGPFPEEKPTVDMKDLTVCPYKFLPESKTWINTLTGKSPLVFHFAGNDWLCACEIFRTLGYTNVPPKFKDNCEKNYDLWEGVVKQGIQDVAKMNDPFDQIFLKEGKTKIEPVLLKAHTDGEKAAMGTAIARRMQDVDPYDTEKGGTTNPLLALISAILFCF